MEERDARISDIFYYFEKHTNLSSGRTVGRKIGVVQELMCKRLLLSSELVRDSIIYEPKVTGRSGATHKVEFVLFQPVEVLNIAEGEQAKSSRGNELSLEVLRVDSALGKATVKLQQAGRRAQCTLREDQPVTAQKPKELLESNKLQMKVWINRNNRSVRLSILDLSTPVATIESKRVGAQRFSNTEKLGSGIQTIEKAKQASLVAVDFDLLYNGTPMAISGRHAGRAYRSFVILGNGVHWTPHDLSVLETYVDYTYLVKDSAIIRYAEYIRERAESAQKGFMPYFMAHFRGLTNTPVDEDFEVYDYDFVPVRPHGAAPLLEALADQFVEYPISGA